MSQILQRGCLSIFTWYTGSWITDKPGGKWILHSTSRPPEQYHQTPAPEFRILNSSITPARSPALLRHLTLPHNRFSHSGSNCFELPRQTSDNHLTVTRNTRARIHHYPQSHHDICFHWHGLPLRQLAVRFSTKHNALRRTLPREYFGKLKPQFSSKFKKH